MFVYTTPINNQEGMKMYEEEDELNEILKEFGIEEDKDTDVEAKTESDMIAEFLSRQNA